MTPEQEKKLDAVFEIAVRTEGKFDLVNEKISQHREAILDQEKNLAHNNKRVASLEGDRNKVLGAMWVTCTTAFGLAVTFIISLFKK
jgi:hypothetical protein